MLKYNIMNAFTELDNSNCFLTTVFMSWKLTTLLKETLYLAPDGVL
jgi:hypothetical protein